MLLSYSLRSKAFWNVKDFVLAICTFFYKIVKLNSHGTGNHHLASNTPQSLIGVSPLVIAGAARAKPDSRAPFPLFPCTSQLEV
jgi:hypothetical protein